MSHRLLDSMRCKSSPRERRWRHRTSSTTDFPEAAGAFSPIFFAARTTRRTACEQMDCVSGNDTHLARPLGPTAPATTDSRKTMKKEQELKRRLKGCVHRRKTSFTHPVFSVVLQQDQALRRAFPLPPQQIAGKTKTTAKGRKFKRRLKSCGRRKKTNHVRPVFTLVLQQAWAWLLISHTWLWKKWTNALYLKPLVDSSDTTSRYFWPFQWVGSPLARIGGISANVYLRYGLDFFINNSDS